MSTSGVSIPRTRLASRPRWRSAALAVALSASLAIGAVAGRLTAPDARAAEQPAVQLHSGRQFHIHLQRRGCEVKYGCPKNVRGTGPEHHV
jgi:anti-sigma-K factor RskA